MTVTVDIPTPAAALAIGAHPDDIDFGCGATLAKWAEAGCAVSFLVCTDGSRGSWDAAEDQPALVARRQAEQRAAARSVGASDDVVFLGWPDGELAAGPRQLWQVAYWIRKLRPDVVLGHDPWKRYRLHPDHRHAGFLTVDAVATAREPHAFPEHGEPAHRPRTLLLFEADEADHVEAVNDAHVAAKLAALESHRSQLLSTMDVDETSTDSAKQMEAFRERIRGRLGDDGRLGGVARGEAFKAITDT